MADDAVMGARGDSGLVTSAALLLLVLGAASIVLPMVDDPGTETEDFNRTALEYQIHDEVNDRRAAHGMNQLSFDEGLRPVARYYSERMASEGFFAHVAPDGESFGDRYSAFNYECSIPLEGHYISRGGENLAQTYYGMPVETSGGVREYHSMESLAGGIVDGWMNSTAHRENILTDHWENQAIGVSITSEGKVYATQNFC